MAFVLVESVLASIVTGVQFFMALGTNDISSVHMLFLALVAASAIAIGSVVGLVESSIKTLQLD